MRHIAHVVLVAVRFLLNLAFVEAGAIARGTHCIANICMQCTGCICKHTVQQDPSGEVEHPNTAQLHLD